MPQGLVGIELVGDSDKMSALLIDEPPTNTIFFPHVPNTTAWETNIAVYNPLEDGCTLTVTSFDDAGAVLGVRSVELGSHQHYRATIGQDEALPPDSAWIKIEGTDDITGFAVINGRDDQQMAHYNAISAFGKVGILPKLEKDGWTGIVIVNLENSEATLTLTAYDDNGKKGGRHDPHRRRKQQNS